MTKPTLAERFKTAFGVDIRPYHASHGFDILKFDDEFVKSGDGESMADTIRRRFDESASAVVEELCRCHHPMAFYRKPE